MDLILDIIYNRLCTAFKKINVRVLDKNHFQVEKNVDVIITETNGMLCCSISSLEMYLTTYLTKESELNEFIVNVQEALNTLKKNEDIISDYLGVFSV